MLTSPSSSPPGESDIYTVSRLNRVCRFLLNEGIGTLWIEGEISNLSTPSSGHLYFTLRDAEAQVRCALFKPRARLLAIRPANGDHVLLKAQVSLYEPRGDFQLIVETLEAAGDGALARAFEQLKRRLAAEGLFDESHKRPLPSCPQTVGVITSPSGAALRDILTVLKKRFPAIEVLLYPVRVQGAEAGEEIVRALKRADEMGLCDLLILGRGGGSQEDLWSFNEEAVARAIHACQTPLVSAVGHETDFTISDFVADLRAPTPSAAAERVSPDQNDFLERLRRLSTRFQRQIAQHLQQARHSVRFLERRLVPLHPQQRLAIQAQRLDELELRLQRAIRRGLESRAAQLHARESDLMRHSPVALLARMSALHEQLASRLHNALQQRLDWARSGLARNAQALHALSPLATLSRGYSLTHLEETGNLLTRPEEAPPGSLIRTRLAQGTLSSIVTPLSSPDPNASPDDSTESPTHPRQPKPL